MDGVAVISDIHSNLEALEAVLEEVRGMDVYCLGDFVDYGANPNEVLELLQGLKVRAIMGNHDAAAVGGDTSGFNAPAAVSSAWTRRQLTDRNLEYLRGLPSELRVELGGVGAYFAHGSPDDPMWEYVDPTTHSLLFGHYLEKLRVGLVGLGHTHVPYVWKEEAGTVFNPGSVGQPRDGDRRASYCTVSPLGGEVENHRVEYDFEKAAERIRSAGLPEVHARRLSTGS
jgi:diadenosine tetraphosphatase ApaH/serine/threonine PP2A family protein phosphatase